MQITLNDSGLELHVKSLSYDQAQDYPAKEKESRGDLAAIDRLRREVVVSLYGEETFDKIKGSNADLCQLASAVVRKTWGVEGEEKNS